MNRRTVLATTLFLERVVHSHYGIRADSNHPSSLRCAPHHRLARVESSVFGRTELVEFAYVEIIWAARRSRGLELVEAALQRRMRVYSGFALFHIGHGEPSSGLRLIDHRCGPRATCRNEPSRTCSGTAADLLVSSSIPVLIAVTSQPSSTRLV